MNTNVYIPMIGDSVAARRKVKSQIYSNLIVGPVVETYPNACRIVTNKGTEIESDFQLFFSDWEFQFLHKLTWQGEPVVYKKKIDATFTCDGCERLAKPIHLVTVGGMEANWCDDCLEMVRADSKVAGRKL
jgi:hypothetical protein